MLKDIVLTATGKKCCSDQGGREPERALEPLRKYMTRGEGYLHRIQTHEISSLAEVIGSRDRAFRITR